MTDLPPLEPLPIKHWWHQRFGLTCCRQCGFVKNDKNADALCKGSAKMRPLEQPLIRDDIRHEEETQ